MTQKLVLANYKYCKLH